MIVMMLEISPMISIIINRIFDRVLPLSSPKIPLIIPKRKKIADSIKLIRLKNSSNFGSPYLSFMNKNDIPPTKQTHAQAIHLGTDSLLKFIMFLSYKILILKKQKIFHTDILQNLIHSQNIIQCVHSHVSIFIYKVICFDINSSYFIRWRRMWTCIYSYRRE